LHDLETVLAILSAAAAWLALLVGLAFLAGRWFFVERVPDEVHNATTQDGWRVAVTRFRPADDARAPGRLPVVLLHGLAANRL
jgi:hypothetical protein